MITKTSAIDRLLKENKELGDRRFCLPSIGKRLDNEDFNPPVKAIADAIEFYGFEIRDELITTIPDIDLGNGNPTKYKPFPLSIEEMKKSLDNDMYRYPYTEGSDEIREELLKYIEKEGFINNCPYSYSDIDDKGLSVHNITFLPSTSIAFNMIIDIISKPGDVVIVTAPNYGLFTIRIERAGAEVETIALEEEDNWLINPKKLAAKIDKINESLEIVYTKRKGYIPRVVAFLNMNPSNPTGKVMGEKEIEILKELGEVCNQRGVFVIDDLVYRDITYNENNIAKPLSTIPGMFKNTISLFGLSKSYGMASLRAGFVVADEIIIRELINRIFQGMDSAPDIVGRALKGAYNTSPKRTEVYNEYFKELRNIYQNKFNILKVLVEGKDSVKDNTQIITKIKNTINNDELSNQVLKGLPLVSFPKNLYPEAGFFSILDFTKIKGKKYNNQIINTERDLLQFFYKTTRTRFLIGQSISWPNPNELVARVTFALEDSVLINAFTNINKALNLLEEENDYEIRKHKIEDQEQIAKIKIDSWKSTYDHIISSKYLNQLNLKQLTKRYTDSFEEDKDQLLVASKGKEILGYSYFSDKDKSGKYDAELVNIFVKENHKGKKIGTNLLLETAKELLKKGKKNMIIWCLSENTKAIQFYKKHGGINVETKLAKIGDEEYKDFGFFYDLETLINKIKK